MASGRSHDRATWLLSLPFGLLWWPWLGLAGVASAAAGFLAGGLWLSPALDTRSNPSRRWGPFALLWWPYRRGLRHRSLLSHSPLLGSALREACLSGKLSGVHINFCREHEAAALTDGSDSAQMDDDAYMLRVGFQYHWQNANNPSGYAAYNDGGDYHIVSPSPEMFPWPES